MKNLSATDLLEQDKQNLLLKNKPYDLEEVLDNITDGFCFFDNQWIVRTWNKTAEEYTGVKREDIVGKDYRDVMVDPFSKFLAKKFEVAIQQKQESQLEEFVEQYKLWFRINIFPSPLGVSFFVKDVNSQKEQCLQNLKSKANIDALINASKDLLWAVDKNCNLIACNDTFKEAIYKLTGHHLKEGDNILLPYFEKENHHWKTLYENSFSGGSFCLDNHRIDPETGNMISEEVCFNSIYNNDKTEIVGVACSSRDITDRKEKQAIITDHYHVLKAKEADLQRVMADLEKVMNSSLDIICSIDEKGHFAKVSAASKTVWGYAPGELEGRSYLDFVAPGYVELTEDTINKVTLGTVMTNFQNVHIRQDGTHVPMLWSLKWDEQEKTMFCIGKDATEMKRAEMLQKETEQRFSSLIQKGADMIGIIDPTGNYSYVSSNVERVIGYTAEELLGFNALSLVHEDDLGKIMEELSTLLQCKERKIADFRFKHKNGEWRWIEVIGTNMLEDELIKGIVINSRDVTDRKNAEEELRYNKERLETVLKATNEAIWEYNMETKELYWNETYTKHFGYHEGETTTLEVWKENIHPDEAEQVWEETINFLKQNKTRYWKKDYRYKKKNGEYAYVLDQGYIILDENNNPIRFVGSLIDNTERKKIELEKEFIIKELTKSNNDLKQFSFITSHNLRAPLSNILGILSIIDYKSFDENHQKMFNLLKVSTCQLQETIKDLTDIIVIRNRTNLETELVHIDKIIENVSKVYLNTLHDIPHEVNLDLQAREVYLYKPYIESIFINLISNAVKYRSAERKLVINIHTYRNEKGELVLRFSDNGLGIDTSKFSDRLFGLYQRFHDHVEGKGLGLFIVRSQVTALGGTIALQSKVNEGATFIITIAPKES
ncbi:PAS domain S-box protein [Aridibaculum aurantiacum]|uniref:PAS domain S-box protein n=1 Tax=Aridibaculum aurantiacum TaxID=2810307 RepID=UPI001A976819|nr:PAS domain S-box protein [Aridibaculum aurantiacum]